MTRKEKRESVRQELLKDAARSNLQIARAAGVSDKTVAAVRLELEGRSEIPNMDRVTDTRGRQQQRHRTRQAAAAESTGMGTGLSLVECRLKEGVQRAAEQMHGSLKALNGGEQKRGSVDRDSYVDGYCTFLTLAWICETSVISGWQAWIDRWPQEPNWTLTKDQRRRLDGVKYTWSIPEDRWRTFVESGKAW